MSLEDSVRHRHDRLRQRIAQLQEIWSDPALELSTSDRGMLQHVANGLRLQLSGHRPVEPVPAPPAGPPRPAGDPGT
jgi:hypothetical protein